MDRLKPYIEAFMRASDRTRSIYIVIMAFSVMCSAAFVNSFSAGWPHSRLEKARLGYTYLQTLNDKNASALAPMTENERDAAKTYIALAGIRTSDEAKMSLDNAMKKAADANTVQVPLFGISFNINDLGLVAGLAFAILMLLLKHCLKVERDNLGLAAKKARDYGVLKDGYEMLSTSEVLHRPAPADGKPPAFWTMLRPDVPVLLLFLPAVVYAVVAGYDNLTAATGIYLSPVYARFILWTEKFGLAVLLGLGVYSFVIVRQTRAIWTAMLQDIAEAGNPPEQFEESATAGQAPDRPESVAGKAAVLTGSDRHE